MQPKRGHLVVIKMGVDTFFSDSEMEAKERFQPGDEGRVVSRTKNGWLRVRICRSGWVVRVRNGPTRIDKPFKAKLAGGVGPKASFAWWVPVKIEEEAEVECVDKDDKYIGEGLGFAVHCYADVTLVKTPEMYRPPLTEPPRLQRLRAFKQPNLS